MVNLFLQIHLFQSLHVMVVNSVLQNHLSIVTNPSIQKSESLDLGIYCPIYTPYQSHETHQSDWNLKVDPFANVYAIFSETGQLIGW
jgi:hypothetical protein